MTTNTSGGDTPPSRALSLYLDTREDELSYQTHRSHRYRLTPFVDWCETEDIGSMDDLDGSLLHQYRLWRKDDGDLNVVSLHTQLSTLRVFIRFCESIELVHHGLHEKIMVPSLDGEERRDDSIDNERMVNILDHLSRFEYASVDHTLMRLLWMTGMRIGEAHALDVGDFDRTNERLAINHRPEGGTTLKNGTEGERVVALTAETTTIVGDYVDTRRVGFTEDDGREPLFASKRGRMATSSLRRHVYKCTQPCHRLGECPHDRSIDECDAKGYTSNSGCPSSMYPHAIRTGSITHWLESDIPGEVIDDRMNLSRKVRDRHYDTRTEVGKAEQRRGYLEDVD